MGYKYSIVFAMTAAMFAGRVFANGHCSGHDHHNPNAGLFVENKGQWDYHIAYRADLPYGRVWLERDRFTYVFHSPEQLAALHPRPNFEQPYTLNFHAVAMRFAGSNPTPNISRFHEAPGYSNFFIGNDRSKWASRVKSFAEVLYENIYEGVGLYVYQGEQGLKYDYRIEAGADPSQIRFWYEGADGAYLVDGRIVLQTSIGQLAEYIPAAWQEIGGVRVPVFTQYVQEDGYFGFSFPEGYDPGYPLVIDPTLVFATYSGSTADNWGFTATYDLDGNGYAGGIANGAGYPASPGAFSVTYTAGGSVTVGTIGGTYGADVAIIKYNPSGTARIWATYIGGNNNEAPHSMVANNSQDLYVFGATASTNFPVGLSSYQPNRAGGVDAYVLRLSADGATLLGGSYLGGTADDAVNTGALRNFYGDEHRGEIVIDNQGNAYVTTSTRSNNFPVVAGFDNTLNGQQDAVVFKFNPDMTELLWSTYLGGGSLEAGYSLRLAGDGTIFVCGGTNSNNFPTTAGVMQAAPGGGNDGFIAQISDNGSQLLRATYLGYAQADQALLLDLDNEGFVYVAGNTASPAFPFTAPYGQPTGGLYVVKINGTLSAMSWSTRLGTQANTACLALTAFLVDQCKNVYVSGWGGSLASGSVAGLPVSPDALYPTAGGNDGFYLGVLEVDAQSLLYGTYMGDNSSNDHVDGGTSRFDKRGIVYQSVCGSCGGSDNFPTSPNPGAWSNTNNSSNCNNLLFKIALDIIDPAIANFSYTVESDCDSIYVTFTNLSENATSYSWNFGDGGASTAVNPVHAYSASGIYNVTLTAINTGECAASDVITLPVIAQFGGPLYDFVTANSGTYIGNGCFRLTQASNNQRGAVWYGAPININEPFDYTFQVNLGSIDGNGADGIAFILQRQGTTNQGTSGGGLGYGGMAPPNLAIEIDTWNNGSGDIACDHVAVHLNGQNTVPVAGPVQALPNNCNIEDGQFHTFRVVWNPVTQTFTIFMDGFQILTYSNDILNNVFGGNPEMYWGFTASTGGAVNVHQVCMPDVPPVVYAPPVAVEATNVGCTAFRANWLPAPGSQRYFIDVSTDPNFGTFVGPYNSFNVGFDLFRDVSGLIPGTTYYYRVYSASPCGLEGPSNVIVVNLPTAEVSATGDEVVCVGDPIRLFAFGPEGATYQWTGPNGFSSSVQTPVIGAASPANAGTYNVIAIAAGCTSEVAAVVVAVQPPPPLNIVGPAAICLGESATLTAVGSEGSVYWLPNNLNTGSITVSPTATTSYTAVAYQPVGPSIVVNGDFEDGNVGFQSDYQYFTTPPLGEGRYAVTNNPQSVHNGFAPCPDHTTGAGNMMVVNGNTAPNAVVWRQTLNVAPGRNYLFSAWLQSVNPTNPARLNFSIDGQQISDVLVAPGVNCQWINFSAVWFSGASSSVTVSIVNENTIASGNDFALDDISFTPVCQTVVVHNVVVNPQPELVAYAEPSQLCDGAEATLFVGGAQDFVWNGPGLTNEPGSVVTFNPPLGTSVYTVVGTSDGGCTDETTVEITVYPVPTFELTATPESICPGESSTIEVFPSQEVSVYYSPPGVFLPEGDYSFDVTPGATTVYTITVFTPEFNCSSEQTVTVEVRQTTEAFIDPVPDFCPETEPYPLTGTPPMGVFSGPGVVNNVFYPSSVPAGTHTVYYDGYQNGCYFADSVSVTVHPAPVGNIAGLAALYCTGQLCVQLDLTPPGGTLSGPGVASQSRFCPSVAGVGFHTLTYSGFDENGCFYSTTRQTEVRQTPASAITDFEPAYCRDAAPDPWTGTPPGGQFLGPGMVGNVFYPNLANFGPNTIVYRGVVNGCQYQTSVTVTVHPLPQPAIIGLTNVYCTGDLCVAVSGVPAGGTLSGPGITSDATRFCPSLAGPGVHTVTYQGFTPEGCFYSTTHTLTVNLTPSTNISDYLPVYCSTDSPDPWTGTPAGGQFLGPGMVGNVFYPNLANNGPNTIIYRGILNGCAYQTSVTVMVNQTPVGQIVGLASQYCTGDLCVQISGLPAGGTMSGPGIASDGTRFCPAGAGPGTHTITYSGDVNGCAYSTTYTLTVNLSPTPEILGLEPDYCFTAGCQTLTLSPPGGLLLGNGVVGNSFCPHLAGPGEHVLRYTGQVGGCGYNILRTVFVRPQIFPVIDAPERVCETSPPVELRGFPGGGEFSGPGVQDFYFYPSELEPGRYVIQYQVQDGECVYSTSFEIVVDGVPDAFIFGPSEAYCVTDGAVDMFAFPDGGDFSGPGVIGNRFLPTQAGPGTHIVRYAGRLNACEYFTTLQIVVFDVPEIVDFDVDDVYCITTEPFALTGTPPGGAFSCPTTGVVLGGELLNPSFGPGIFEITYSGTFNECEYSITKTVEFVRPPLAEITGLKDEYCVTDEPVMIFGTPEGGIFNAEIDYVSVPGAVYETDGQWWFNPGVRAGLYRIHYTGVERTCVYYSSVEVWVHPAPNAQFLNLQDEYCTSDVPVRLYAAPFGGFMSATPFVGETGRPYIVENEGYWFNPDAGAGTVRLYYFGFGPGGCQYWIEEDVVIYPQPEEVKIAGIVTPICAGAGEFALTGTPAGGSFHSFPHGAVTPGGVFRPETGPGVYTIVYTGTLGVAACPYTTADWIRVTPVPDPTIVGMEDGETVCHTTAKRALAGQPCCGEFYVDPPFGINGIPALTDNDEFDPAAGPGTYDIYFSGIFDGCPFEKKITVHVTLPGVPQILGANENFCPGMAPWNLTGTSSGGAFVVSSGNEWAYLPDGVFPPAGSNLATGNYVITYLGTEAGCGYSSSVEVRYTDDIFVFIEQSEARLCVNGAPVVLSATPQGGTFSGPGVVNGVFYPELAGVGKHPVVYQGWFRGCPYSGVADVYVREEPAPAFVNLNNHYCTQDTAFSLEGMPEGGTWTGAVIVSGNRFVPHYGPGLFDITYTVNQNGCETSTTLKVAISEPPAVNLTLQHPVSTEPGYIHLFINNATPEYPYEVVINDETVFSGNYYEGFTFARAAGTYEVVVRLGQCEFRETVTIVGPALDFCPETPQASLAFDYLGGYSGRVSWQPVSNALYYEITVRLWPQFSGTQTFTVTNPELFVNNLIPDQSYRADVVTVCSNGLVSGSSTLYYVCCDGEPVGLCDVAPTFLNIIPVGTTGATVTWTEVIGAVRYELEYRNAGGAWTTITTLGASATLADLTSLNPYELRVRAQCAANTFSPWSASAVFSSCPPPTNINVTGAGLATWNAVAAATFYTVSWRLNAPGANWINATVSGATTSFNIPGLQPGRSYQFRIRSRCGTIFGVWSPNFNFSTGAAGRLAQADEPAAEMVAYPNPNRGDFELKVTGLADAPGELWLWDGTGRLVFRQNYTPENGRIEVNSAFTVSGIYQLVWRTEHGDRSARITVAR